MRDLFILFVLVVEFLVFAFWISTMVSKYGHATNYVLKKVPVIIAFICSIMLQAFACFSPHIELINSGTVVQILGELIVKAGFMILLVTRIMISLAAHNSKISIIRADWLITMSTSITIAGFLTSFFANPQLRSAL